MSITERLANLPIPTVIIIIAVLVGLRFLLLKLKTPASKSMAEVAESLAVAMALVFLLIRPFIVQAFFIPSASMHPTLLERDHILVNKFIYRIHNPRRGDVIVFKSPPAASPEQKDFIKRVIAVPGDTVRITGGHVIIGTQQYNHPALRALLEQLSKVKIEDGQVYEDNKVISTSDIAALTGLPPSEINVDGDRISIGLNDYDAENLKMLVLSNMHSVKLVDHSIYRDGVKVSNAEVAKLAHQPGAKVKVVPGVVYVNGKALNEPYTAEDPDDVYPGGQRDTVDPSWIVTEKVGKERVQEVKIPKGKLLVMGDNRNDSNDARFWGLLDRDRVLGKAMFIFWPLNRIRWVH